MMRSGSRGFLMVADFDKYEQCRANADRLSIKRVFDAQKRKAWAPARLGYSLSGRLFRKKMDLEPVSRSGEINLCNDVHEVKWYHWGSDRACKALAQAGFEIVEADVQVSQRDPVIHFRKP